jgi:outer membrane protein assembly factor BamB
MVASESDCFVLALATSNLLVRERFERVVNTSPVWEGANAYFGCSTGEVLAHDVGRGVKRWGFMSSGSIDSQPVRVADTLAIASAGGDITFLTYDGTLRGRNRVLSAVVADRTSRPWTNRCGRSRWEASSVGVTGPRLA